VRVSDSQNSQNIQTTQDLHQQLDQIKYEINTLREERRRHQQTMSSIRTQLQEARDQIERGTAENVAMRQEMTRLTALLQESREEVDRLNEEMFRGLEREEELLDQVEAAHDARRRRIQAAEEELESSYQRRQERGGKVEYVMARSVRPGWQLSSHHSKHHSSKRKR
jgi:chromosome segregation ATPase